MSQSQSRITNTEWHIRKSGRSGSFGRNRGFSGNGGGGGGISAPPPAFPSSAVPRPSVASCELSTDRSFKHSVREQSEESRLSSNSNADATREAVVNGTCKTATSHGLSDGLASESAKLDSPNEKKISRAVPKVPATTVNEPTSFLQFGTINPGIVKGMQVPARTCSAPPNLDEQKSDQVRHDSLKVVPAPPTPSAPKPLQLQPPSQQKQQTVKVGVSQTDVGESHPPAHVKRDIMPAPIPSVPSTTPARSSVLPVGRIPMHMPFQDSQIPVQFSGSNMHIPPQHGVIPTSFHMSIPLSAGSVSQVPQQMFVPSIQSHPMQPQAIMHHGQNLGFVPQFGHQISPQLSSMGMGITTQFPQQQSGLFFPQRRAVKITHPETHEELKLDKRTVSLADSGTSGQRKLPNTTSQSSSLSSFNHQTSYYPTSYNHSQIFFPSQSSLPLTSTQMTVGPQGTRYSYPVGQKGQPISFTDLSPFDPAIGGRPNPPPPSHGLLAVNSEGSSFSVPLGPSSHVTPASLLPSEKTGTASVRISMPITKPESSKLAKLSGDVPATHQQKDEEAGYQSTDLMQKQNCEQLITSSFSSENVKNNGSLSSTSSTDINESQTSSLFHAPVSDAFTIVVPNDDSRKEEVLIPESDQQKSLNKMELKFSQEQIDIVGPSLSNDSASEGAIPTADSSNSALLDSRISELDEKKNRGGALVSLRSSLEKESLQGTSSIVSDPVEDAGHGFSFVDNCNLEESTSPNIVLDGILRTSDSSIDMCSASEVGGKQENPGSESMRDGTCDDDLLTNNSPDFTSIGGSDETTGIINQDVVTESSLKSGVGIDDPHFACPEEGGSCVSAIMDATCSFDIRPEEKVETAATLGTAVKFSTAKSNIDSFKDLNGVITAIEQDKQPKAGFESREDVTDASFSELRESDNGELENAEKKKHVEYVVETSGKRRYSRDFLLTFSEQYKCLPDGFEIGSDLTNIMSLSVVMNRSNGSDTIASTGRIIDKPSGTSRGDRRMAAVLDGDRWTKSSAFRMDHSHEIAGMNFRPVQGDSNGVLRNPSMHSINHFSSGIISGPLPSFPSQSGIVRNNSDLDRWQRVTGIQRGLIPPQGPLQVMHKSAARYEIGKVSDEEEQKQRRLKAILNKLTPQNFEKLFAQVKEVNIDNTVTLTGVISQIFDKALMEPTFCEMYADFCFHLATELPDFVEENEKITFRRLLLNKCQEEFERGEIEQAEADKADEEGEIHQTEDEREEKRIRARRRVLGNIRLIGELYKKKMLTERIMHECMKKLLGQYHDPDEENIEALCKLMSTIGEMIDHSKAREHMDAYFDVMGKLSTNHKLSSRVRFMLKDTIDLRKNRWRQRRKIEGPKKIEDVHRDAAQERQAQTSKPGRGPNASSRRGAPADYGHRGSTILSSSNSQPNGNIRGLPRHVRGSSSQDSRLDERQQCESRILSVPLSHRPTYDGSVTLGPQGGLAKGMSGRGQGLISNIPSSEISQKIGNSHRLASGSNGCSSTSTSDYMPSISRDESMPKVMTDRSLMEKNDQISLLDRNSILGTKGSHFTDRAPNRFSVATSGERPTSSGGKISATLESKVLSEDTLREKSISAIREFYSAKDEKEIVQCIKDLNTPSFYSSMISLWVTDSFERKHFDRSLLAQLLVKLTNGPDSLIGQAQLIEGFESVLFSLEDTINDAPKAAEFLGDIFGRVVGENVVQLREIGKLILEGGEAPGTLVESGFGSEILGSALEFVKMVKGESFLNAIIVSSNLQLDHFKPPNPSTKSKKLNAFL